MIRRRSLLGRGSGVARGHLSPSGQLWQVPSYPHPQVVLTQDTVSIDGYLYTVPAGHEPRDTAVAALVELAVRLRPDGGAIGAAVRTDGDPEVFQAVVTTTGDVFDATTGGGQVSGGRGGGGRPRRRVLMAAGSGVVAVVALVTAVVVVTSQSPPPTSGTVATGPPPTGTPVPYPDLPPAGFAGRADWSAPIASDSVPLITTTGLVVTVSPTGRPRRLTARAPGTGVPVWSAALPSPAGSGPQGLRLSVVDGAEAVVATTPDTLLWWAVDGADHAQRSVTLPPTSTVSYAGATPLVTWPGQHAGLIIGAALITVAVPAGAVAMGATATVVVAVNNVGQVWRLSADTAGSAVPAPVGTARSVGAATTLATIAGYAAPTPPPPVGTGELLILTWLTADPATRVVSLLDATTASTVGNPVTVPRAALVSTGWQGSDHHRLGAIGEVLIDVTGAVAHVLPPGWATTAITDTQVFASPDGTGDVATATGVITPTGSGVTPLGVAAGSAVVTATAGTTTTVYGLPPATTPPTPTPSLPVPAPPPPRPPNPTPGGGR